MANVESIGKAQAFGAVMEKLTGVSPSFEYHENYVRVYFQPDRLKEVQRQLEKISTSGPGDVRIDWFPMITPIAIKKGLPIAAALFFLGYFLRGKI